MNTDSIDFSVLTNLEEQEKVAAMMRQLHEEDWSTLNLDFSRFASSIEYIVLNPSAGQIVLFREDDEVKGYALLVPFWSNEFGGTILFVDELFVEPASRNRGIGRSFFRYLEREQPFRPVAFGLGVSPRNSRARRLYESVGFVELSYTTLTRPVLNSVS
jgi:GNAT superfamily N-acetyltransferase